MNKLKKWLVAFTAIIAVAFSFAAIGCKKSKNVTLTYDVGGGTEIAAVSAAKGTEVELATTAEKEGYEFAGWYLSSDYSGEKVTKITLDADTTVYAKWGKLYLVSIVAEGGTATPASVYVKAGEVLLTKLESVSAQKTDCKFGEWQVDGKAVTSSYVMPEKDITVNAKFMTKYTVEIYREGADGNYVKDAEPTVDYAYAGTTPDKNFAGEGYELVKNASGSKPISAIKETASENNFVLYYKRMDLSVTFRPNYPADAEHGSSVGESKKIKYGEEVAVPYDYTAEGYYLAGWSTKTVDATVEYAADYIYNKLYDKTGATPVNAKVAPSSDVVLYGVWVKGYRDMFGGKDYLFVSKTEENTVYMSRENYFFKGRIFGENGTKFLFRLSNNDTLEGRFLENEFFAYQHVENVVYTYFKIGTGIQKGTTIKLDAYNGIDYHSGDSVSSGTYEIDDNGVYVVTYSSGDLAGKTAMLFLTQTTLNGVNTNVYLERDEEEYGFGLLATYGVVNGSPAQYTLSVRLNGFGNAGLYINNVYRGAYTYSLNKTTGLLTISKVGTYLLTDYNGNKVLFNYDSDEVKTYTSTNGKITVSTDGAGRATLTDNGTTATGYYETDSSVFGGEILTFTSGSASRVFLTGSVESEDEKGDTVTTYTLEEKAAGYAEYYFAYNSSAYYTPFIVLNDSAEGYMTIYGRTVGGKFVKIADGTYTVTDGIYNYTRKNDYLKDIVIDSEALVENGSNYTRYYYTDENGKRAEFMITPVDVKDAAEIKFGTHIGIYSSASGDKTLWVSYIYSVNGAGDFVKEYTSGNDTLTLISGIAVYDDKTNGHKYTGNYSIKDGMITISSGNAENYKKGGSNGKELKYLELNETDKTFVALTFAPYKIGVRYQNGSYSSTAETIALDGKGGATYTIKATEEGKDDVVYTGKVTESGKSLTGGIVYTFTSEGKTFDYIVLVISNKYYFAMKGDYNETIVTDDGTLKVDGFGFGAQFGEVSGKYTVLSDETTDGVRKTVIRFIDDDETLVYYFDVVGETATRRGSEYGTYIQTDNNHFTGNYILFDGYGTAKIYNADGIENGEIKTYVDENGTYEAGADGIYTLNFKDGEKEITVRGKLGVLVLNKTAYKNFIVVHEERVDLYVNGDDWSMIRLDNANGATRYSKKGVVDKGDYILITESLIYFVNSDGTDACIYEIDTDNKTAEMRTFTEFGYYTEDFHSLYFTEYGYAIYNGSTRYFYTVSKDNKMTIYHQPEEKEVYDPTKLNRYNFIEEDFGVYDPRSDTHEPKTFRGETYLYNTGATISFTRNTVGEGDNAEYDRKYPVSGGKDVKLYATALKFRPNGSDTFNADAQIQFNGNSAWYSGKVVREKSGDDYVTYFSIAAGEGNYRMYLNLTYSVNGEGESTSVFEITSLKRVVDAYSNAYLDVLYMMYQFSMMFGQDLVSQVKNTQGIVHVVFDYDEAGNEIIANRTITTEFLADAGVKDSNGRLIQLKDAKIERDEKTGIYTVEFTVPAYVKAEGETELPAHDDSTYKLYFTVGKHQRFTGVCGYTVAAFVRCQTFDCADGYTVEVERLVYSDTTKTYGGLYSLVVKKDGVAVTNTTDLAIINTTEKGLVVSVMVRTPDKETGKITATTYYVVTIEDEASGDASDNKVKPYKSATVTAKAIKTVYAENGEDFVDVDETADKITFICFSGKYYAAKGCEKSENGTYTVKISDALIFEVTVTDGKARITQKAQETQEAA